MGGNALGGFYNIVKCVIIYDFYLLFAVMTMKTCNLEDWMLERRAMKKTQERKI
jgi:hypothetical protein